MRKPIIAGNWKMFKTVSETKEFIKALEPLVADARPEVLICPTFTSLETATAESKETNIQIGAQNIHWEEEGAFTGEIAPKMVKELGVTYCLVGHSERRQYFGETDESINKKIKAALKHGLKPILCVGESLAEKEGGKSKEVCRKQVEKGLAGLKAGEASQIVIAYEPIWAIGTGKTASAEDAQTVIAYIRQVLSDLFGEKTAQAIRIQYGGSVKAENIKELMSKADIDGALVGGASLEADSFAAIVNFDD